MQNAEQNHWPLFTDANSTPTVVTMKNVSRYCQVSLGRQNHCHLRTTDLTQMTVVEMMRNIGFWICINGRMTTFVGQLNVMKQRGVKDDSKIP